MTNSQYFGLDSYFNENVTFYKDVTINGNLNYDSLLVKNLTVNGKTTLGITTTTDLYAQNLGVFNTISTVNINGNLTGNINSAGLSTFSGGINVGTGVSITNQSTESTIQLLNVGSGGTTSFIIQGDGNLKLNSVGTRILNSSGNPVLRQEGSILQVIHSDFTTSGTITAANDTDISGFSTTITPSASTSKILAIVHFTGVLECDGRLKLKRNGVVIRDNLIGTDRTGGSTSSWNYYDTSTVCSSYLDTPNTTSLITYQISVQVSGCSNSVYYNRDPSGSTNNGRSGITLMEVAG